MSRQLRRRAARQLSRRTRLQPASPELLRKRQVKIKRLVRRATLLPSRIAIMSAAGSGAEAGTPDPSDSFALPQKDAFRRSSLRLSMTAQGQSGSKRSIIQFATDEFYCVEEDGMVEVTVVRIASGTDLDFVETVDFVTQSGSAVSGTHFQEAKGSVVFGFGEYSQKVRVVINTSPVWMPTLHFTMKLQSSEGENDDVLRDQFRVCRIWILHPKPFPTAAIEEADDASNEVAKKSSVDGGEEETAGGGAGGDGAGGEPPPSRSLAWARLDLLREFVDGLVPLGNLLLQPGVRLHHLLDGVGHR